MDLYRLLLFHHWLEALVLVSLSYKKNKLHSIFIYIYIHCFFANELLFDMYKGQGFLPRSGSAEFSPKDKGLPLPLHSSLHSSPSPFSSSFNKKQHPFPLTLTLPSILYRYTLLLYPPSSINALSFTPPFISPPPCSCETKTDRINEWHVDASIIIACITITHFITTSAPTHKK